MHTPIFAHDDMVHLSRWHNGDKTYQPFSANEMENRQQGLHAIRNEKKLDACILTSYHNICYYSGFVYCYFGRKYAAVLSDAGLTTVSAGIDGGQPWRRSFGDNITYSDWKRTNFYSALAELLTKNVSRVGIEFDHVSLDFKQLLNEQFPQVDFVDISLATMWQRSQKSIEEHQLIRKGAEIASLGGRAVMDAVQVGIPEHEVAIAATNAMIRAIAASFPFIELMDTWTWFQSGINTDGAHNPVTNKIIESGDILSLNTFPMIFGYYTALERTLFCKQVTSDAHYDIWQKNCQVHTHGMSLLQPGKKCSDIAKTLNAMYKEWNLLEYRSFGYGHSFGVLSHYYGREAGVELREDIDTILQPGMVISMEPMVMLPETHKAHGGYREHDIVIITENGNENITNFPYGTNEMIVG